MIHRTVRKSRLLAFAALTVSLVSYAFAGSSERVVHSFAGSPDGSDPATALTFDSQGNIYGTTATGGSDGCGTVFQLVPAGGGSWQENVLFSFNCFEQGKNPYGGVTLDAQGNLYGTTVAGGSGGFCTGDGCGVVYKLAKSGGTWNETVLYNFGDSPDGWGAGGAVAFDSAGNLYGTTPDGGANEAGTVYQLAQNNGQWTETIIHDFTGGDDGGVGGLGRLLVDSFGNIYGVAEIGGMYGAGTLFRMQRGAGGSWQFATLYAFQGQPDAGFPYGGLIADTHGNLYGTTYYGGANGAGTVYKVGPRANARPGPNAVAWRESVLYSFQESTDGGFPLSTLVFDPSGNLLGTTSMGGDPGCDCGVAFMLTPNNHGGWDQSVLHTFGSNHDAAYPNYGLTSDGAGNYFGTGVYGGSANMGAAFELTP